MKTFTQYIAERGAAPTSIKFICSQSKKEIKRTDVIDYTAVLNDTNIERIFTNIENDKYGKDYKIFMMTKNGDIRNIVCTVLTDNEYKFEKTPEGGVIYNADDERETYDKKTLKDSKDFNGIAILK